MQSAPSAEERRAKMAQQRQLVLSRQRNAVLSGLGVVANRDVPTGGPSPTSMQHSHKQVLGRILLAPQTAQQAPAKQEASFTLTKQGASSGAASPSPPASTGSPRALHAHHHHTQKTPPRRQMTENGLTAHDGIEVCQLDTPLVASMRPEGVEAPQKPAASDTGLWNLQCEVLQASPPTQLPADATESAVMPAGGAEKKPGKRSTWVPWRSNTTTATAAKPQVAPGSEQDENRIVELKSPSPEDRGSDDIAWDNSFATPMAAAGAGPAAADKRPSPHGLRQASSPVGAASQQPPQPMPMPAVVESISCLRPESPSESARQFCRPERVNMGPPPFGVVGDPFDDLQEMLLSN